MRSKSRVARSNRHRPSQPETPQGLGATIFERTGVEAGFGIPRPSAKRRIERALAQRQIVDAIETGFSRIEAILRLGLGIDDPSEKIADLEAQLSAANDKIDELTLQFEEATGEDVAEAEEPFADDQETEDVAQDEAQPPASPAE